MFPVMYVGTAAVPQDVHLYKLLDLGADSYPLLMNFQIPNDVLLNYFMGFGALTTENSSGLKKVLRSKRHLERAWRRIRFEHMDAILEAHDLAVQEIPDIQQKEKRMREIYLKRFPDADPTKISMKRIAKAYDDWLKMAEDFKGHYAYII